jgi:glutathione S-transferase
LPPTASPCLYGGDFHSGRSGYSEELIDSREARMTLTLYAHPFSSYCQKVLIALYENGKPFAYRVLGDEQSGAELEALWPIKRFPVLVDDGRTTMEATIIIEHLGLHHPGPVRLIPEDPREALDVRLMDRFFDNYVMTPMQKIVFDSIRPETDRDPYGVAEARTMLDRAYGWLDKTLAGREWAAGSTFSLADCAAAPSLFYADWAHPIAGVFARVRDYRRRLLARPSFAQAVDEARPYRGFFPLGAPDRD